MTKRGTAALILAVALLAIFTAVAFNQVTVRVSSLATINAVNIAMYKDANLTQPLTSIDWGRLEPGQTVNYSAYLKSLSNVNTTLSLATEQWNPLNASNYINLTWNYTPGYVVPPNASGQLIFTLTVNSTIQGITSFSFIIDVTATEK